MGSTRDNRGGSYGDGLRVNAAARVLRFAPDLSETPRIDTQAVAGAPSPGASKTLVNLPPKPSGGQAATVVSLG